MQVFTPIGSHTSNSSLSSAVTLTAPAGANSLRIQALTQNVRVRQDGSAATASVGFRLTAAADTVTIPVEPGGTVSVIEETASANIQYQFGNSYERLA